jgi:hypothetical protein
MKNGRKTTLDFTDVGYPGFTCARRLNLPLGTHRRGLEAQNEEESRAFYLEVFPSWDFVDEDGEPIPVEAFDLLPLDLWKAMQKRGLEAVKEAALPTPLDESSSGKPPDGTAGEAATE